MSEFMFIQGVPKKSVNYCYYYNTNSHFFWGHLVLLSLDFKSGHPVKWSVWLNNKTEIIASALLLLFPKCCLSTEFGHPL